MFLATVLKSVQANIVILAPYHPSGLSTGVLHPFADACVWVKGSGLDVMDLLRAGILEVSSEKQEKVYLDEPAAIQQDKKNTRSRLRAHKRFFSALSDF